MEDCKEFYLQRYRTCMLENPNTGKYMAGSVGTLKSGTTVGNMAKLSGFYDYDNPVPEYEPMTVQNVCTEWAFGATCQGPELQDIRDVLVSDPKRPTIMHTRQNSFSNNKNPRLQMSDFGSPTIQQTSAATKAIDDFVFTFSFV